MSRAAQILNALESTRATSADEFAALLGVSRRTVAGEVSMLQELLGPVASITLVEGALSTAGRRSAPLPGAPVGPGLQHLLQ